jgi:hypothetical protein
LVNEETFSNAIQNINEQISQLQTDVSNSKNDISNLKSFAENTNKSLANLEQTDIITNKRLANLESATLDFIEDSTVAYQKTVPENALPYAEVTKIGGMTRKCTNLWDEASEQGSLRNGDNSTYVNSELRTINYIKIQPNTTYYTNTDIIVSYYNANKEWVQGSGSEFGYSVYAGTFTTPSDTHYMRFYTMRYGTTYNNDVIIAEGSTALPYEPYFEGLRSAPVSELVSEGVNLFDAKNVSSSIQYATVSLSGNDVVIEGTYYASFSIKLKANVTYSISYSATSEKIFQVNLKYKSGTLSQALTQNQTFIPLEDVDEIYLYAGDGVVAKTTYHNFMLNKGSTALPYRPYFKRTLPIPEAVRPAHGINENVYDYIEWCEDGTRKKRVKCGVVDLGTLNWYLSGASHVFYSNMPKNALTSSNFVTPKYNEVFKSWQALNNMEVTLEIGIAESGCTSIAIKDTAYTDVASFKAAMSGVMLLYELAGPEVTDISDILTADNFVEVQAYGSMTPVNEFGYAVPTTINYITDIGE